MTNKQSFILHCDSLEILKKLSDEEAGKLFKSIADYQKEKIMPSDRLISLLLEPFISQFSRDEKKYKKISDGGRIGNLKKYHREIFLKFSQSEITLEEAEKLAAANRLKVSSGAIGGDRVRSGAVGKARVASLSDSDSDSVSDSVNIISSLRSEINISEDFWKKFLEHRKKVKASLTFEAQKLVLQKLKVWKERGHDPENIIKNSIENGWKGIFEPKQANIPERQKNLFNNFKKQDYEEGTDGFCV